MEHGLGGPARSPPAGYVDGPAKVRVLENGPVRVALEITREARGSHFVQVIRLANGAAGDRVEFADTIDWQTQECSLKAGFPAGARQPAGELRRQGGRARARQQRPEEIRSAAAAVVRPDGNGRQVRRAAVLNDSKFGGDKPDDKTMRLTLLYTPGVRNDYQDQATQDFGRHQMLYALAGHQGDWRAGNVPAQAARLNQPLAVFQTTAHPGKLGREFSLLRISSGQVAVAAVKKAEDGNEIVIRLKELTGDGRRRRGGFRRDFDYRRAGDQRSGTARGCGDRPRRKIGDPDGAVRSQSFRAEIRARRHAGGTTEFAGGEARLRYGRREQPEKPGGRRFRQLGGHLSRRTVPEPIGE